MNLFNEECGAIKKNTTRNSECDLNVKLMVKIKSISHSLSWFTL